MATKTTEKPHGHSTRQSIRLKHYFDTNVKTFSLYDNVRSIPKLTDGLKPSQRKSVCGTLARGENAGEMQLERLASMIAAHTDYHHGANSLVSTIVGMANDKMPGMNNMNLFQPEGQFGSRLTKEAGAGRYIFTKLSPNFRKLFKKEDDCILEPIIVDGEEIEPKTYIPILPIPLVNGAQGTGTGHACNILSYHPNQLRDAVLKVLDGKKLKSGSLTPWFRGYHGTVERNPATGQVVTTGKLEIVSSTKIKITELPLGEYLDSYKETLNKLEEAGLIRHYDDRSTEESFDFICEVPRSTTAMTVDQLMTKFKLIGRGTENFTLWNPAGILQKYDCAEAVIEAFVPWRLDQYEKRRAKLLEKTTEDMRYASEVIRFIRFYLSNTKTFKETRKAELIELLLSKQFVDYEKLLAMPIWNLTRDRIEELEKKLEDLRLYFNALQNDTATEMYKRELAAFDYKDQS
jgi:DNA topoisomerase-2